MVRGPPIVLGEVVLRFGQKLAQNWVNAVPSSDRNSPAVRRGRKKIRTKGRLLEPKFQPFQNSDKNQSLSDLSWRPFQKFGQNQAKEVKKRFGQKPGKTGQFRNDIWGYYWGSLWDRKPAQTAAAYATQYDSFTVFCLFASFHEKYLGISLPGFRREMSYYTTFCQTYSGDGGGKCGGMAHRQLCEFQRTRASRIPELA
ncbi:hypothetical protein CPB85DRAFT_1258769 [Mucidula mucida]|nr:hypothetical protein CPB85DRAFT_1258769 [Mucidula mucida]